MADEPENLTMRLLQEIRSEMREGFEKAFGDLAALRKDTSGLQGAVSELQHEVAAMRVDQRRANELLERSVRFRPTKALASTQSTGALPSSRSIRGL